MLLKITIFFLLFFMFKAISYRHFICVFKAFMVHARVASAGGSTVSAVCCRCAREARERAAVPQQAAEAGVHEPAGRDERGRRAARALQVRARRAPRRQRLLQGVARAERRAGGVAAQGQPARRPRRGATRLRGGAHPAQQGHARRARGERREGGPQARPPAHLQGQERGHRRERAEGGPRPVPGGRGGELVGAVARRPGARHDGQVQPQPPLLQRGHVGRAHGRQEGRQHLQVGHAPEHLAIVQVASRCFRSSLIRTI